MEVVDLTKPIQPCCDKCTQMQAVTSVRATPPDIKQPLEYGYILQSLDCDCASRWVPYDWRNGHAEFITITAQ